MDWLKKLAPTLAAALGGPLAGVAVQAVGAALGWEESTKEKVEDLLTKGNLTGDQIAALKVAELEMVRHEREMNFKFAELEFRKLELDVTDRNGARSRESSVKDNTNRVLAYTIVGSFVALVGSTLLGYARVDTALAGTLVGYLSAKAEQVLSYYFGSTAGSWAKTMLLGKQQEVSK